ncbi:LLM class F420-dependent oxidoreductase [Streptomyces nodosus]|uniref:LLM class F420-dependent oxidoreductase n=1 Tax=Streptomyces nodosus TaxID=40318 RepID=UPI00381E1D12
MRIGVSTFVTDQGIDPVSLGRAVEERGFESLFLPEHTHIPVSRESPYVPMRVKAHHVLSEEKVPTTLNAGPLPERYARTPDPFVALAAVAAVTHELLIGTGILLAAQRDPIILAKQVASLDWLSGGRFVFGVGAGWNREELRNHGVEPRLRTGVMREHILAAKEIWTHDEAEFHGRYVDFAPVRSWPKPVQRPWPPVLIGGEGEASYRHALEYGDGWAPIYGGDTAGLVRQIRRYGELAEAEGRSSLPVTVFWTAPDQQVLEALAEADVHRVLLNLPWAPHDAALRHLDMLAAAMVAFDSRLTDAPADTACPRGR